MVSGIDFETQETDARAGTFGVYTSVCQFTSLNQHIAQCFDLHVGFNLALRIPTCFNSKGIIMRE
jgi:hypothetical protein